MSHHKHYLNGEISANVWSGMMRITYGSPTDLGGNSIMMLELSDMPLQQVLAAAAVIDGRFADAKRLLEELKKA